MHEASGALLMAEIVFGLLLIAVIVSIAAKKIRLPLSVALVVLGLAAGYLARSIHEGPFETLAHTIRSIELTPELILFIFLPALVFESAYNLDVRQVTRNLAPIMMLAVPGLLLSTAIVGGLLHLLLGLELMPALLFGALISATDPVAVIALFKEVGAPRRLTTLVEGESLFNDATAIVLFSILLELVLGGETSAVGAVGGFLYVFVGGAVVGGVMGFLFALLLGAVRNDELIEVTLTVVLAYVSFIVADHFLHVSGVMATVGAGLVLGSYGRTKISPPVIEFMHSFWEYLAYVANAMIFLLVGLFLPVALSTSRGGWGSLAGPLAITLAVVFLARAAVVFSLVPLLGGLRIAEPIDRKYQTVIFWGGLRGAIALALALALMGEEGLPANLAEFLLALTAGVVLFTLTVNSMTMGRLMRAFGLDRETDAERLLRHESMLEVQAELGHRLDRLRAEGLLMPKVVDALVEERRRRKEELGGALGAGSPLSDADHLAAHRMESIRVEKQHYLHLFEEGNLSEGATRDLMNECDVRLERMGKDDTRPVVRRLSLATWIALARPLPLLRGLAHRWEVKRVAELYERARGRHLAAREVQAELEHMHEAGVLPDNYRDTLVREYGDRRQQAEDEMADVAEQFPEYVTRVQELLGARILLNAEGGAYTELHELGVLTAPVYRRLQDDVEGRFDELRKRPVHELDLDPCQLLAGVPLFSTLSAADLEAVAAHLRPRSCVRGETLFREGQQGSTMFLIGRGVIKVIREQGADRSLLATLSAGDYVGEMALLHPAPRTATAETATVASLLELHKTDLDELIGRHPQVGQALERAYEERKGA